METLLRYLRIFGFWDGLKVASALKLSGASTLQLPGLHHPIHIRPKSIDRYSIEEVFVERVYAIDWPEGWPEPKFIIDGGANIGCTTAYFASRFPDAQIVSLEPESENFHLLLQNTKLYSQVEPLQAAVWKTDGFILVEDKGFGKRGFMVTECDSSRKDAIVSFSTSTLLQKSPDGIIDILKLDIEGSEKEVFSEAFESWLPNCRCVIVELHDRMKEGCSQAVFKAFSKFNFSCEISGGNLVFYNQEKI